MTASQEVFFPWGQAFSLTVLNCQGQGQALGEETSPAHTVQFQARDVQRAQIICFREGTKLVNTEKCPQTPSARRGSTAICGGLSRMGQFSLGGSFIKANLTILVAGQNFQKLHKDVIAVWGRKYVRRDFFFFFFFAFFTLSASPKVLMSENFSMK